MSHNTQNKTGKKRYTFGSVDGRTLENYIPTEKMSRNVVLFGEDNQFPQHLFNLYSDCSLLQTLCNGTADYIAGNGTAEEIDPAIYDLIRKVTLDYTIFGAFAVQVRRNTYGDIISLDYIDVQRVRLDETGEVVYYNKDWGRYTKEVRKYDRYREGSLSDNAIFYYKSPLARGTYGLPLWSSSLREAQTLVEITKFHLAAIVNGLHSPMIINFNNGQPTDEEKQIIESRIKDKFCGTDAAGRFVLAFNESKDNGVEIAGVPDNNYDTKYSTLKENATQSLLTSFRASAQLFGVSSQQTGFSSIEYQESFALFNSTVIGPLQRQIERAFSQLGITFHLLPFNVDFTQNNG